MLQDRGLLHPVLRKYFRYAALAVVALALLPIGNAVGAGNGPGGNEGVNDRGAVRLLTLIPVPVSAVNNTAGALYSFDISWVDQVTQIYYLADRSNSAVDIVDAKTNKFLGQLAATPAFAGASPPATSPGPNGVVTGGHCLFVTDAPSRVVSFDTTHFPPTQVSDVQTATPTANRADELAYDPQDKLLLVINNADTPPFGTFITVNPASCALTQPTAANKITFDAAHGVNAQGGAEQPVWVPETGTFFLSIPQIGATVSHGGVVRIAPNATSVAASDVFGVDFCGPAGLAVGPFPDLLIGCNKVFDTAGNVWDPNGAVPAAPKDVILDIKTGKTTDVPGVGAGDEVWHNAGDNNYYATGSGSPLRPLPAATAKGATPLGVIDAEDETLVQLVPTYNVPAGTGHPAGTAHSVAANAQNNFVFVPLAANNAFGGPTPTDPNCLTGCIAVYFRPSKVE